MRFAFAHKVCTYLVVITAYLAVGSSGELGPLQLLLAFAGIIASWWWEPPRVKLERYTTVWTVLSVIVFAYSILMLFAGADVLITGANFLNYLLVAKLFNRRQLKDYQQVYVLTFLLLVAGTVLNTGFSYGIFFLGYVVCSTWAMILHHLRREMEENFLLRHGTGNSSQRVAVQRILNSKRIVGGKFFVGTSVVSVLVFVSATVLFLAIPRIGFGLFFNKKRANVSMAGFSDGVQLGGHGAIKDDPTIVMRVKIDRAYRGDSAPPIHWRGVAFDHYRNGQWMRSRFAPRTQVTLDHDTHADKARIHLQYDRIRSFSTEELDEQRKRAVRQEIYLEPLGSDVLFGASMPAAFEFGRLDPKERSYTNDELRHSHGAGIKYVVYSFPEPPAAATLRAAPDYLPKPSPVTSGRDRGPTTYEVYLQVPPEVTERTRALARQITKDAPTRYDKAVAIERYLRQSYGYTLQQAEPTGEPIDFFLFERKQGHCEYFSSAMTIMLREVGIPARNVNGFLGGAWNEYDNYIAVRGGDAHSWVEVLFPTAGWVTFDPTPPGETDLLGRGQGVLDKLARFMDTLKFKWFQWVIEYDLYRQLSVFRSVRGAFGGGSKFVRRQLADVKQWARRNTATFAGLAALLLAICAAVLIARRRKRQLQSLGVERQLTRAQSAVARCYLAAQERLARRGHRRGMATTPREHATQLVRDQVPGAGAFANLAEVYYRAIYGAAESPELADHARGLRDQVTEACRTARGGRPKPA